MSQEIGHNPEQYQMPTQPGWFDAPGVANTAAVLTFQPVAGQRHFIYKILWAYNAAPTGGVVQVFSGGQPMGQPFYITSSGPGFFLVQVSGMLNRNLSVQLTAAGAAVTGSVGVEKHWARP